MRVWLAIFAFGLIVGGPVAATAAPAPQPLSITFHGDGARATQLPQYDPAVPIAVNVKESGGRSVDAVTVVAAGPAGESVQSPLTRGADGSFTGTLVLHDQGPWQVHLTSRIAKISADTSPVTLDVVEPPPSNAWQIGLAVGAAVFVVVGGSGFFLLRRTVGTGRDTQTAQAA